MDCPGHYSYRGAAEEDRLVMGNGYNEYRKWTPANPASKGCGQWASINAQGPLSLGKDLTDKRNRRLIPALPRLVTTGSEDTSPTSLPLAPGQIPGPQAPGAEKGKSLLLGRQGAHPLTPRTGTYGAEVRGMWAGGAHRDRVSGGRWHVQNWTLLGRAGYS